MDIYQQTARFYENVKTEKTVIGQSLFRRNIYAVKIGDGSPVGVAQYAMHGREFVTAKLAFAQYNYGLKKGSFWIVPLVNPDGALLSQVGLDSVQEIKDRERLLRLNGGKVDFSLWKANGRGVDLNVNFPARWGTGRKNVRFAGAENYIGEKPFSEPETLALKNFTEKIKPDYTISYHTKGEEIYWYFYQSARTYPRDKRLAKALSLSSGYPLAQAKGSAGGYKDWCISAFKIPAFTVEVGADWLQHPIVDEGVNDIIEKNGKSLYDLTEEYLRIL
ncbi:MAG: hypothetical protein E7368_04130 [Clostridiales bacterium]|nr:hypothetical protein [Clostridiales bacterium]